MIQVHIITIGGRPYISNLLHPVDDSGTHDNIRSFDLCGSKYLAVKGDGVGVVDIAFEPQQDRQPNWVLHTRKYPR